MNPDRRALIIVPLTARLTEAIARPRRAQFEAVPVPEGRFVFLGDSITQRGLWDQWLPELPGLNRGIDGDSTTAVLGRLDSAINRPVGVSLLVGTNDLHGAKELRNLSGIATRTEQIVRAIGSRAPEATVFLNSVMPRTPLFAPRIRRLNELYREVADRTGSTFIDLWPVLADAGGGLRSEFTRDHLHLLPEGYRAWSSVLRPQFARFAV